MENKELNLSKIRELVRLNLKNAEPDVAWIIDVVFDVCNNQDKEFIKRLKEELFECDTINNEEPVFDIIDKLAGKDLVDITRVQVLARHSNIATTNVYTHLNPKFALDDFRRLF